MPPLTGKKNTKLMKEIMANVLKNQQENTMPNKKVIILPLLPTLIFFFLLPASLAPWPGFYL